MNDLTFIRASYQTDIKVELHRGVMIVVETDTRGADYGESVKVEWHGRDCDFNTVEDAQEWIDGELDTDFGFDPIREWGTAQR